MTSTQVDAEVKKRCGVAASSPAPIKDNCSGSQMPSREQLNPNMNYMKC
jgi:hypothetical protein